jgi:adenylate cyclase
VFKRTGDGALVEFRSVVDAVRCAIEVQNALVERNAGVPLDRQIEFRIGILLARLPVFLVDFAVARTDGCG